MKVESAPVFNTIKQTVVETGAQVSVVFIVARVASAALFNAIGNGS